MTRLMLQMIQAVTAGKNWILLSFWIAALAFSPRVAFAVEVIPLNGDVANSSTPGWSTTLAVTLNDPFLYDPLSPTSPLPAQTHPNGFHGNGGEGEDVYLSYNMIYPVELDTGEELFIDVWGRSDCCWDRDDNFDIEFYNGGVLGTFIDSLIGMAIPNPVPQHYRASYIGTGTVVIDSFRIVAHDSNPSGANYFTLMETRAATVDGEVKSLKFIIDRDTREITMTNNTTGPIVMAGLSFLSDAGALDPSGWTSITGHYDATPPDGNSSVSSDEWIILANTGEELGEATLGSGTIAVGQTVHFGAAWGGYYQEMSDLSLEYLDANAGEVISLAPTFVGNDGNPFDLGDLNFDGNINISDWQIFRDSNFTDLSFLTIAQAYRAGDLDGDGMNNLVDFGLFKTAYEAENGPGSFAAMIAGVPEPATWLLLAFGGFLLITWRHLVGKAFAMIALVGFLVATTCQAQTVILPGTATNHALSSTATQSSESYGGVPERAVDGNINGAWGGASVTHTDGTQTDPWWRGAFLAGDQDIEQIILFNRLDCCGDRLRDITITIRDAADTKDVLVSPLLNPGNSLNSPTIIEWDVMSANGGLAANGGIVRINRTSDPNQTGDVANTLSLAEVFALGTDGVLVRPNIAVGYPAIQSTTAYGGVPERAVDGITNGNWGYNSVTHTDPTDNNPWWQVDLGILSEIDGISLWNRTDCCSERLEDITIQVFAADGVTPVYTSALLNPGNPPPLGPYVISENLLGQNIQGRYVRVTRTEPPSAEGVLSLAEVQVFGERAAMTLQVNTQTGGITLKNNSISDFDIDAYSIESPGGALNAIGWNSLQDQDFEGNGAPGSGNGWEESGGSGNTVLAEIYLLNSSIFSIGNTLSLGNAFNPSVFGLGNDGDLTFTVRTPEGVFIDGLIEYVTGGENADFNGDGDVDGADFLAWQRGFGITGTATLADGDANGDANVNGADLAVWKSQFGTGGAAGVLAGAAVPEPGTMGLLGLLLFGIAVGLFQRKRGVKKMSLYKISLLILVAVVAIDLAPTARADSETDRLYRLGDDAGDNYGSGGVAGNVVWLTVDSYVTDTLYGKDQQDLDDPFFTEPKYVNVSSGQYARSGVGAGELGVRFDGVDDFLQGLRLGLPSTSAASTGYTGLGGPGPLDYTNIWSRGFQVWVYPEVASGSIQDVVMDTNQHGLRISASGDWVMVYGSAYESETPVVANQWSHVLVVDANSPGADDDAFMYVNGIAIWAATGSYASSDMALVLGASTGTVDGTPVPGQSNFFTGVLDELDMFVMGVNGTGYDYGTFNPGEDNDYIAAAMAGIPDGDITGDGNVSGDGMGSPETDDVAAFVLHWRAENLVNNIPVGDLASRGMGDFNYDGVVNYADWYILRANHPSGSALNLGALLAGAGVPEPSSVVLLFLGLGAAWIVRRR
ncbi:MAG: discoidin domain-containing protein [Pirellulales bacterium]|nr:discoidin domain-containing protein [Pirellulales bacterium]